MYRHLLLLTLLVFLASCQNRTNESPSKYYEDGRARPTVAIVPVVDSTSFDYPWSLSEEFSNLLATNIAEKQSLYLPKEGMLESDFSYDQDLFSTDLTWMKNSFYPHEFVVLVEFLKHDKIPLMKRNTPVYELSSNLEMAVRVRIIDLRKTDPKIILQETIADSYFFSKNLLPVDYQVSTWGTEEYATSPLATAHKQIAKEVVERINDYILLAKSR